MATFAALSDRLGWQPKQQQLKGHRMRKYMVMKSSRPAAAAYVSPPTDSDDHLPPPLQVALKLIETRSQDFQHGHVSYARIPGVIENWLHINGDEFAQKIASTYGDHNVDVFRACARRIYREMERAREQNESIN